MTLTYLITRNYQSLGTLLMLETNNLEDVATFWTNTPDNEMMEYRLITVNAMRA